MPLFRQITLILKGDIMDRLSYYIEKQYGNNPKWFQEEVNQGNHAKRINDVINNRDYLAGRHKVLLRQVNKYREI